MSTASARYDTKCLVTVATGFAVVVQHKPEQATILLIFIVLCIGSGPKPDRSGANGDGQNTVKMSVTLTTLAAFVEFPLHWHYILIK